MERSYERGESHPVGPGAPNAYHEAQARFADHLRALRASGKAAEAEDLEKRVQATAVAQPISEKVEALLQTGDQALNEKRYADAKTSFAQAVSLAEQLPAGSEQLISALIRLAGAEGWLQDYSGSESNYRRSLAVAEQAFGPGSPKLTTPLYSLGALYAWLKDYASAQKYYSRALEIDESVYGEKSAITGESLRTMAGFYMVQGSLDKAEPYLLRAVKANEFTGDDLQVLTPLWGLCSLYDQWGKPDKSQPCWHRANGIMEKESGETSPDLIPGLTNEAHAWALLGRKDEAAQLQGRADSIQKLAAKTN